MINDPHQDAPVAAITAKAGTIQPAELPGVKIGHPSERTIKLSERPAGKVFGNSTSPFILTDEERDAIRAQFEKGKPEKQVTLQAPQAQAKFVEKAPMGQQPGRAHMVAKVDEATGFIYHMTDRVFGNGTSSVSPPPAATPKP